MASHATAFMVQETHGVLLRPTNHILASSDSFGWVSLYASTQREAPFQGDFRSVDDHLIVLHLDGPVTVERRLGGTLGKRIIPAGGMFIVPGGMDFGVRLCGVVDTLHVYLRRSLLADVAADLMSGDPEHLDLMPRFGESDPLLEQLLLAVHQVIVGDGPAIDTAYVEHIARAAAARLIRAHSTATTKVPGQESPSRLSHRQLKWAIDFMKSNLDRPIGVAAIAEAVHVSCSHLARRFRDALGIAPHQYLMQLRLDRAARLLVETSNPIPEIALACGFSHQEHLTRLFKRSRSTTPAAYRRDHRRRLVGLCKEDAPIVQVL